MEIVATSYFKDVKADINYFNDWVKQLELANSKTYERISVATSLGNTHVWGINAGSKNIETLVIFPGARTTALIWDFDNGLNNLNIPLRIFLVETNGLPNLSDGKTPDIKSLNYGNWATEIMNALGIEKAFIAGASFGGLICMKLGIVNPERVKAAFILNPGCLQPFSLTFSNLYYNILPLIRPSQKNVLKFLNKAIFSKPNHMLTPHSEMMLIDYEMFAIRRYQDNTQKPYYMDKELAKVNVDTYLLEGTNDLLFPFQKSLDNARKHLKRLKDVKVFESVGHGIETYHTAMNYIGERIRVIAEN